MAAGETTYLRDLKSTLTGDPGAALVFVCNFEVESSWAGNYVGLPAAPAPANALVQRMEELGVLLAGPGDHLVLKQPLDDEYREYLENLDIGLPSVLVPEHTAAARSTSEDLLDSPRALGQLTWLGRGGARLVPMGTSAHEEKLAEAAQIRLAVPGTATFEKVNSKIYSRRITAELGLPCVPGWCCETVGQFRDVLSGAELPVVVKDAYGVSGKGLMVLDSAQKAARLLRMIERRASCSGDDRLAVVVERWLPRRLDLNYQIAIDRGGEVRLDFVKQALTDRGVHQGHLMPVDLGAEGHALVRTAAARIGGRLYRDGFTGVAGIDAIVTADDGRLYPVLEINARFNMSTYQGGVSERFHLRNHWALAQQYPVRVPRRVGFGEMRRALGALLRPAADGWTLVTCFGTINANVDAAAGRGDPPYSGRLYVMHIAPDQARLADLDEGTRAALTTVSRFKEGR
jgi:hypothetical protein